MRTRLTRSRSGRPVVVCGADSLALRLVEELVRMEESVTVVVDDPAGVLPRRMADLGARLVRGSAREVGTLRAAGVESARALALVDEDDVGNIHAALAAQELNPGLRLVVRMFNLRLGRRLDDLFDECTVLSASAIAAPFFVDAALGAGTGTGMRVAGRDLVAGPPEIVREVLTVLAGVGPGGDPAVLPARADGATLVLGPALDRAGANRGDGPPPAGTGPDPVPAPARRWRRSRGRRATLLSIARSLISQRLRLLFGVLAGVIAVATAIFHAGVPHLGWVDAFYFTVAKFTATGGSDLTALGVSTPMKVFGAGLTLIGVITVALVIAAVVDDLVGARLALTLGVPVGHPHEHLVVCGLGAVGLRVAEQLRAAGVEVVGIERDPDASTYRTARRLGIPLVHGDASEEETLRAASVGTARCVLALTDDDVTNLEAGLASRAFRPDLRVVLRLFDSDLADRVGNRLNLTISRSVSVAAAPVFAAAMMGHEVIAAVPSGRRVLFVAEVPVRPASAADGSPVAAVDVPGAVRVVGRASGGAVQWRPPADTVLRDGDGLIVVATRAGLARALMLAGAGTDIA